jgi:hypothetical protein
MVAVALAAGVTCHPTPSFGEWMGREPRGSGRGTTTPPQVVVWAGQRRVRVSWEVGWGGLGADPTETKDEHHGPGDGDVSGNFRSSPFAVGWGAVLDS